MLKNFFYTRYLLLVLLAPLQLKANCSLTTLPTKSQPAAEFIGTSEAKTEKECEHECKVVLTRLRDQETNTGTINDSYKCEWFGKSVFLISDLCTGYSMTADRALISVAVPGHPPKPIFEIKNGKWVQPLEAYDAGVLRSCLQNAQLKREFQITAEGKAWKKVKISLDKPINFPEKLKDRTVLLTNELAGFRDPLNWRAEKNRESELQQIKKVILAKPLRFESPIESGNFEIVPEKEEWLRISNSYAAKNRNRLFKVTLFRSAIKFKMQNSDLQRGPEFVWVLGMPSEMRVILTSDIDMNFIGSGDYTGTGKSAIVLFGGSIESGKIVVFDEFGTRMGSNSWGEAAGP